MARDRLPRAGVRVHPVREYEPCRGRSNSTVGKNVSTGCSTDIESIVNENKREMQVVGEEEAYLGACVPIYW